MLNFKSPKLSEEKKKVQFKYKGRSISPISKTKLSSKLQKKRSQRKNPKISIDSYKNLFENFQDEKKDNLKKENVYDFNENEDYLNFEISIGTIKRKDSEKFSKLNNASFISMFNKLGKFKSKKNSFLKLKKKN